MKAFNKMIFLNHQNTPGDMVSAQPKLCREAGDGGLSFNQSQKQKATQSRLKKGVIYGRIHEYLIETSRNYSRTSQETNEESQKLTE